MTFILTSPVRADSHGMSHMARRDACCGQISDPEGCGEARYAGRQAIMIMPRQQGVLFAISHNAEKVAVDPMFDLPATSSQIETSWFLLNISSSPFLSRYPGVLCLVVSLSFKIFQSFEQARVLIDFRNQNHLPKYLSCEPLQLFVLLAFLQQPFVRVYHKTSATAHPVPTVFATRLRP